MSVKLYKHKTKDNFFLLAKETGQVSLNGMLIGTYDIKTTGYLTLWNKLVFEKCEEAVTIKGSDNFKIFRKKDKVYFMSFENTSTIQVSKEDIDNFDKFNKDDFLDLSLKYEFLFNQIKSIQIKNTSQ